MITHFGWKMVSSSRLIASGFGLALALSFAIPEKPLAAQATPQDTAHKGMKMPANMPMGKKPQKKKTAAKPATTKKSAAGKSTAKTVRKSAPASTTVKKPAPRRTTQPMAMPMGADTAHHEMGGMNMQPAASKRDSTKMPDMPGMEIPSKPTDS